MTETTSAAARWLDRFFDTYYRHRPVNATFIGVHEHDGELPDWSERGAGDTLADLHDLLARSASLDARAASAAERIDLRLARGFLRIQIRELESRHFQRGNPSLWAGEAVFGVMSLFLSGSAPPATRRESAVRRMRAIPAFLEQARCTIERAPVAWTQRAIRECRGALAFFREGIFHAPLEGAARGEPEGGARSRAADAAFRAAADEAAAAFAAYREWLERDLLGRVPSECGCGTDLFSLCLREGHFLDDRVVAGIASWAGHAEQERAAAAARLEDGARRLGAADGQAALAALADCRPSAERYLERYREIWEEARAFAVERKLLTWPDFPITYVPRPLWARAAAPDLYFLFYRSPAAFGRPPVHEYLVTPVDTSLPADRQRELLRAANDGVIRLNHVIHHGGIGHHVQNWHAFRAESRVGRIAAVDCASRIALSCGGTMAEGWACYATDLMAEAGYLAPLERLAELQSRMRMCARAVADIGIHTAGWTLEQAARYYESGAGMTTAAAHAEAVRNSMFPGAALMYLAGTDAIHELRRALAASGRGAFDPCRFHDELLAFGSIPVSIVAEEMKRPRAGVDRERAAGAPPC